MKKLFICLFFIVIACSSKSGVVLKDTDYLKYGTKASVIQKVWGEPEETMAFQDFQARRHFYSSSIGGSWGPYGGSIYGYGLGSTYVPTTIVWIYREKRKALFFQKSYLLYDSPGAVPMVWRLVGWENLRSEKTSVDDDKIKVQIKYAEREINKAGIKSDSDIRIFWAVMEKAPKDMPFDDQIEWAIKRTKEIMTDSEKR
ncbi:MAG: hypothetical protein ABSH06_28545 [Thermodesulfobacteriota bacterium]